MRPRRRDVDELHRLVSDKADMARIQAQNYGLASRFESLEAQMRGVDATIAVSLEGRMKALEGDVKRQLQSAEARCIQGAAEANPCQCNRSCKKYADCCADFDDVCGGPSPPPSPSPTPPGVRQCTTPAGPPGGAEQLHVAMGESPREVSVTFATSLGFEGPACSVQGIGRFSGATRPYTDGGWKGLLHTVEIRGLEPSTNYTYDCGSGTHSFRTAPSVGTLPVTVAAVADLGMECSRTGCGNATIDRLNKLARSGAYQLLVHAGDIAYTSGKPCVWDDFFRELEPATSSVPYMVAAGNHEHYYNFSGYRKRFAMPGEGRANEALWYSFDFGGVHVVALSTEHDLTPQATWLREDLENATRNRALVPWIVVMLHKPLYCSTNDYYDCKVGCHKIAGHIERLLQQYGVDLVLAGHLHNYERTWPVFNGTVSAQSYTNPSAPVHLVVGMAGDDEGLTDTWMEAPAWRATKDAKLGFAILKFVDATQMTFEYVLSETGDVADSFKLEKLRALLV